MKPFLKICMMASLFTSCMGPDPSWPTLYVGTYTEGESEGIYSLSMNPKTGELDHVALKATLPNPSFLALSANKEQLYAVQETDNFDASGGGVSVFNITEGKLTLAGSKGTAGAHPCHVALSDAGQLAVSNYTGGNVAIFDLEPDGSLGDRQVIATAGDQDSTAAKPHAHMAQFIGPQLFVADLGLSTIKRYQKQAYGWVADQQPQLAFDKAAGTRHFVLNTDASKLYAINELNSTITVFTKDATGHYQNLQTISTLAKDFKGESFCADIHLSDDGRFLYGTNRGENTIVVFSVDQATGMISPLDRVPVEGDWPRNFTLSPKEDFVLIANQRSNNISVFKRDKNKGTLTYTSEYKMDAPVCLVFE